ncbi:MAG: hypothetical protein DME69_00225 [Verrucomicrobia bacterium]|nr:MAG: hypothetical protein DME69_00225 [Verrucomicrobiota bacterium]
MRRSSSSRAATGKDREAEIGKILTILHKWGIHTLGQLAALDKEQLGARLGPEAIRMWERANGQCHRVLKLVRPPESFEESFEFENKIETAEPLLFMLRRFLEQLAVRLRAIYLVAKELTLRITFANSRRDGSAEAGKQVYERVFKIPQPTNDVDLLFRMLHTHLENFKSEYPIIAVSLQAEPAKPSRQQFGLFATSVRDPNQLYETLLWGKQASPPARKPAGKMPACPTAMMAVLRYLQRYVGFDRPHPRRFSVPKIHRRTFAAPMLAAKSSSSAALIWLREIGGMKWHGFVRNGICNWITEFWRAVTEAVEFGKWMGFMTKIVISSGTRDLTQAQSSTLSLQRDPSFVGEVLRLRSG